MLAQVLPVEKNASSDGGKLRDDRFENGRFTGAIGSDERDNSAALHAKTNVVQQRAPKIAVIELMLTSVGAKAVRAMRSHIRQNAPPPRKHAGMSSSGSAERNRDFIRCGTAMPTKEM